MAFRFTPPCCCDQTCPPIIPDCELVYDGYPASAGNNQYVSVDNLSSYDDGIGNRCFEVRFSAGDNTIYFHIGGSGYSIDNYRFCLVRNTAYQNCHIWFFPPDGLDQYGNPIYSRIVSLGSLANVTNTPYLYDKRNRPVSSNFPYNVFAGINFDDFYVTSVPQLPDASLCSYQCYVLPFNEDINPCEYAYGSSVVITKRDSLNEYFKTVSECGFINPGSCSISEYCDICDDIITASEFIDWLDNIEPDDFSDTFNVISIVLVGFDEDGIVGEYNAISWCKNGDDTTRLSFSYLAQHSIEFNGNAEETPNWYTRENCPADFGVYGYLPGGDNSPCSARVCFGSDIIDNTTETAGTISAFPNRWRITNINETRSLKAATRFHDVTNDNNVRFNGYYWIYALCKPCGENFDREIICGKVVDFAIARYTIKYSEKIADTSPNRDKIPIVFENASEDFSIQEWESLAYTTSGSSYYPLYKPPVMNRSQTARVATDMSIHIPEGKTVGKVFWRAFKDFVSFNSDLTTYQTLDFYITPGVSTRFLQLKHSPYNEIGNKANTGSSVSEEQATQMGYNRFKKSVAGTSYKEFTDDNVRRIVLTMDEDTVKSLVPERTTWTAIRSSQTSDVTCYIRFPIQYFVIWKDET